MGIVGMKDDVGVKVILVCEFVEGCIMDEIIIKENKFFML